MLGFNVGQLFCQLTSMSCSIKKEVRSPAFYNRGNANQQPRARRRDALDENIEIQYCLMSRKSKS